MKAHPYEFSTSIKEACDCRSFSCLFIIRLYSSAKGNERHKMEPSIVSIRHPMTSSEASCMRLKLNYCSIGPATTFYFQTSPKSVCSSIRTMPAN